ncbi:hypothetical protein CSKR_103528 [Clonorchis sinensis]|uniref:Uncharacterized protein n=1 Tax=Clonorchis sinensis TaxID=79923 RepID=A0A419PJ84_CLOSI|nr:hypothetical protein CSKR_103528 [Clonorchis sinensis]
MILHTLCHLVPTVYIQPNWSAVGLHSIVISRLKVVTSKLKRIRTFQKGRFPQPSGSKTQSLLSVNDNKAASAPNRLWRNLARLDSLQPPNFLRSRGAEASITSANGLGQHFSNPPDDRLWLTDPSLLPPPKVCSLARDCVSRDPDVHSPHLQTANGVSPTKFLSCLPSTLSCPHFSSTSVPICPSFQSRHLDNVLSSCEHYLPTDGKLVISVLINERVCSVFP